MSQDGTQNKGRQRLGRPASGPRRPCAGSTSWPSYAGAAPAAPLSTRPPRHECTRRPAAPGPRGRNPAGWTARARSSATRSASATSPPPGPCLARPRPTSGLRHRTQIAASPMAARSPTRCGTAAQLPSDDSRLSNRATRHNADNAVNRPCAQREPGAPGLFASGRLNSHNPPRRRQRSWRPPLATKSWPRANGRRLVAADWWPPTSGRRLLTADFYWWPDPCLR